MTAEPIVRSAGAGDVAALVVLLAEMDRFYGSEPGARTTGPRSG